MRTASGFRFKTSRFSPESTNVPPLVIAVIVILGLFMLFPKGFKYMVGLYAGFALGFVAWTVAVLCAFGLMWDPVAFLCFIVPGLVLGWILAAKG